MSEELYTAVTLKIHRPTGARIVEFTEPEFQSAAEALCSAGIRIEEFEISILPFVLGRCSQHLTEPCWYCSESGYVLAKRKVQSPQVSQEVAMLLSEDAR